MKEPVLQISGGKVTFSENGAGTTTYHIKEIVDIESLAHILQESVQGRLKTNVKSKTRNFLQGSREYLYDFGLEMMPPLPRSQLYPAL